MCGMDIGRKSEKLCLNWDKAEILRLNLSGRGRKRKGLAGGGGGIKLAPKYKGAKVVGAEWDSKVGWGMKGVKYLGVYVNARACQKRQVMTRINATNNAWEEGRRKIFMAKGLPLRLRISLWKALVKSVTTYGLRPNLKNRAILKLEACQMKCVRMMVYGYHWYRGEGEEEQDKAKVDQTLSNGELRHKYGIPTVSSVVRKIWTGEVIRWKTNVPMAFTEGGEEPSIALKILRERWEQHKKSWLVAN